MKAAKDLVGTYVSASITVAAPIIAIPFYLKNLGSELWGLFSAFLLIQTGMQMIEQGYSQSVMKDLAEIRINNHKEYYRTYSTLLFRYLRIGLIASAAIVFFGLLAAHNLDSLRNLDFNQIAINFLLIGLIVLFQLASAISRAGLLANERHGTLARINIIAQVVRHLGGVILSAEFPTITTLLLCYTLSGGLDALLKYKCMRKTIIPGQSYNNVLDNHETARAKTSSVTAKIDKSARMLSIAVFLGTLTVNIDRFFVGHMLGIVKLGLYTLASTIAMGALQAVYPLGQVILPKLIMNTRDDAKLKRLNFNLFYTFTALIAFGIIIYSIFGARILNVWLRNQIYAGKVFNLISIMLVGVSFNAIFNIGYWNWIAKGLNDRVLRAFCVAAALSLLTMPILISKFDVMGASIGWVFSNFICMIFSLDWMFQRADAKVAKSEFC
jgi:O-antigen/teichoic acid export membrane protein